MHPLWHKGLPKGQRVGALTLCIIGDPRRWIQFQLCKWIALILVLIRREHQEEYRAPVLALTSSDTLRSPNYTAEPS